ncbi:MAG: helix-turn-helix domain-containing protein [Planctomycetota bacterium]|jgi:excisionase family DNA binding protein
MDAEYLTPAEVARRWGVSRDKVAAWIRRGQLRAINMATEAGRRPRWRIPISAIDDFEALREARGALPQRARVRRAMQGVPRFV